MNIEKELTILEIERKEIEDKLNKMGAIKKGDYLQKRLVYDFNPKQSNKWIRLRTNGEVTTLTIKEVIDNKKIDGTKELEIEVSDFNKTNLILNELGYNFRNYQENLRTIYLIDNVEISIDTWPLIPTYMEIEGKSNEDVLEVLNKINPDKDKITTLDVESIYKTIYGIDVMKIKELKLNN